MSQHTNVDFPSLKARKLLAILKRKPLSYAVQRQKGSHRTMRSSAGYPDIHISGHEADTIGPDLVKKILCNDVGLNEADARKLL